MNNNRFAQLNNTEMPPISSLGLAILVLIKNQKNTTCQNLFTFFEAYSPTLVLKTVRYLITHQLLIHAPQQQTDPPLLLTEMSHNYLV